MPIPPSPSFPVISYGPIRCGSGDISPQFNCSASQPLARKHHDHMIVRFSSQGRTLYTPGYYLGHGTMTFRPTLWPAFLCAVAAFGQGTGEIHGTVSDPNDLGIYNATVRATHNERGFSRTA